MDLFASNLQQVQFPLRGVACLAGHFGHAVFQRFFTSLTPKVATGVAIQVARFLLQGQLDPPLAQLTLPRPDSMMTLPAPTGPVIGTTVSLALDRFLG